MPRFLPGDGVSHETRRCVLLETVPSAPNTQQPLSSCDSNDPDWSILALEAKALHDKQADQWQLIDQSNEEKTDAQGWSYDSNFRNYDWITKWHETAITKHAKRTIVGLLDADFVLWQRDQRALFIICMALGVSGGFVYVWSPFLLPVLINMSILMSSLPFVGIVNSTRNHPLLPRNRNTRQRRMKLLFQSRMRASRRQRRLASLFKLHHHHPNKKQKSSCNDDQDGGAVHIYNQSDKRLYVGVYIPYVDSVWRLWRLKPFAVPFHRHLVINLHSLANSFSSTSSSNTTSSSSSSSFFYSHCFVLVVKLCD